ncbi:O(6)-methylguanine-induced apoptosis 2 isoform X2 [Octopus bimaculoides]|uniref:O(6)-methylguanine-induced apoptosis 2 isoform X2 n=1 Tax=Octopus bimaculoides TaxID=37653 RepID=UPI00071DF2D8|nr:O(6)-methylguanine-induced apoptosis 2 isoform X2 [Octopus bimaculoides]|eukprot:XP_014787805.1 PREDICTED: O(6)-methylguanine-induced apoptosis 2-like isoform X2 [Octopus bimaculoides]
MQKTMDKVLKDRKNALGKVKGTELITTTATIPSKYQTVVIVESDKKGFLTTAKRFKNIANDIPGPGKYETLTDFESNSASYSKKGTGGLASLSKRRFSLSRTESSGTFVSLPSSFSTKHDFNRSGNTRAFQKNIAEQVEPIPLPAPNQYQISSKPKSKMSAESAFRSQTKRDTSSFQTAAQIPGPCQYSVNYDLVLNSPKAVSGPFKSKSSRIQAVEELSVPGPGSYNPEAKIPLSKKPKDLRKHYLCLSAPAHQLKPQPTLPGPGTYEIKSEFTKKVLRHVSSPAFVSTAKRMGPSPDTSGPGPVMDYHLKCLDTLSIETLN